MAKNRMYEFPDFRGVPDGVIVEHKTETGAVEKLEFVPKVTSDFVESAVAQAVSIDYQLLPNPELDR